jgi:hypothetical protein
MKMAKYAAALLVSLVAAYPASARPANSASTFRLPDFAGRDKQFAYLRARIVAGMREGANFADHYTIVTIGCGTGCTHNLMVDRKTGAVSEVPFGGEKQQLLTLRYRLKSNLLVATWFDGDLCVEQRVEWNGTAFEISDSPRGRPDEVCRS